MISEVLADRAAKLQKIKGNDELFSACWIHYASSAQGAVDFINDWGMTYDPRLDVSIIPFKMFPRQEDVVKWLYEKWDTGKDGLIEKTRDVGLTWIGVGFSVWMWTFQEEKSIAWGSRKEDLVDKLGNMDSILEKVRFFIRNLPKIFIPTGYVESDHARKLLIVNPANGSFIKGEAGDNIGRGGRSSIYLKDESAFYERPGLIDASVSMNSNVKIDISTPNGNGNPFYQKRFGGIVDVFTFNWHDDPRKDKEWFDETKRITDPVIFAQEVLIDYDASVENALIPGEPVDKAMAENKIELLSDEAPVILGVDVARFGSDAFVVSCRQGRVVHFFHFHNKKDLVESTGIVLNIVRLIGEGGSAVDHIFVDETGVGGGIVDNLKDYFDRTNQDTPVTGINFGGKSHLSPGGVKCHDKRSEMWLSMKQWMEDGRVYLPNEPLLKTDLCGLQYSYNSNGEFVLESKDKAKKRGVKSPDRGDSLCLTFAEPVYKNNLVYHDDRPQSRNSVTGY